LRYNLVYLLHLVKPLVVTLPIFVLFLVELDAWFTSRPFRIGEPVVVSVFARPSAGDVLASLRVTHGEGLRVETQALRIPEEGRADWRVRALAAGEQELEIITGDPGSEQLTKLVRVGGERLAYIPRTRSDSGWLLGFLNSEESPLPPDSRVSRIEVDYPDASLVVFGWSVNWVAAFVVLSLAFAFLLKRPFGLVL
jgi:hypothetical protein